MTLGRRSERCDMLHPFALGVKIAVGLAISSAVHAQAPERASVARETDALRVFLDCRDVSCDHDFFRTEIAFVQHVRDRRDADVYVLLTAQQTGDEGSEFTVKFIGQRAFAGAADQLRHVSGPSEPEDQVRQALVDVLKRGLVRYVNQTPLGKGIQITYEPPVRQAAPAEARDPWRHWTFSTTLNGFFEGEEGFSGTSINLSLSANHTTEQWKINTSVQTRYSENKFALEDERSVTDVQRNYALNGLLVKSLGPHWSAGARGTITSSSFLNQSLTFRLAPAIEYNFFPYSESTRWQFTLQYSVGVDAFDYSEETIFGKTAETLVDQRLLGSLRLIQPWGSVTTSLEASHYLQDMDKQRGILFSNIDLSLSKGLSLILFGTVQLVRDQIYLPRRGASEEEILLRQRQLGTSFVYSASIGFSYTFGSSSATVVNPRFSGSTGGTSIIS
jgi:hypothetical protein